MGGSWVVGGWVVGGGSCLFEDKKRYILAPSVLGANLSKVLGLVCFENFHSFIKKRVRLGLGTHDQRPTTHDPPTHAD